MGFQIANSQMLIEYYERQMRAAVLPEDRETFKYGRDCAIQRAGTLQFFPEETATVTYWTALPALPAISESSLNEQLDPDYCPEC